MTENKRFTLHKGLDTLNIMDNTKFNEHIYINKSSKDMELLVGVLNALHEETLLLRLQLNLCSDQRDEFHRGARENANRVGKLEKENEQLKGELRNLRRLANELYMEKTE